MGGFEERRRSPEVAVDYPVILIGNLLSERQLIFIRHQDATDPDEFVQEVYRCARRSPETVGDGGFPGACQADYEDAQRLSRSVGEGSRRACSGMVPTIQLEPVDGWALHRKKGVGAPG